MPKRPLKKDIPKLSNSKRRKTYASMNYVKNRQKLVFIEEIKFKEVCSYVSTGMLLYKACELAGVNIFSFWNKMTESDVLKQNYLVAKEAGAFAYGEAILEIADNLKGVTERDKLRIETRKWLMGKFARVFADKQVIQGDPNKPIVITWRTPQGEQGETPLIIQGDEPKVIGARVIEGDNNQDD